MARKRNTVGGSTSEEDENGPGEDGPSQELFQNRALAYDNDSDGILSEDLADPRDQMEPFSSADEYSEAESEVPPAFSREEDEEVAATRPNFESNHLPYL